MMTKIAERMKWAMARFMILAATLCCTACNSIFDEEGDCTPYYFVKFVYDMNMLRADAFATQVGSVDLYVFEAGTGKYVTHLSDQGEALASGSYRMPLNLAPGKYEFIAWCGLADNNGDFSVAQTVAKPEDLWCSMARSQDADGVYSGRNLHAVFHGIAEAELPDSEGEHTVTVFLTKDTNNINLSLQHTAGPLDPDRFEVTMTDENGLMAYDNSLLADDSITYRPWSLRSGTLDVTTRETAGTGEGGFLIAELSTARLMADHTARITIMDKQEDKVVFSIPFIQWALLLRSANHANMDDQEYLDREDEYNLMVFLSDKDSEGESWMAVSIYINGWHVINNNGEVEL